MMLKSKEIKVIEALNQFSKLGEVKKSHRTESYDCESDRYIFEIKCRDKRYDSWILEKSKFDSNIPKAEESGRDFIYVVEYNGDAWLWNISEMNTFGFDFKWESRTLPTTTQFRNKSFKSKELTYLWEANALHFKVN
jgi:hypothetical protein|tara:strand:- start:1054 stop:1464 length:411 start_codon:yes stop_codon:yes gene_type:complete